MFHPQDVLPQRKDDHLSPEQHAIGHNLRRYYQFTSVAPTPKRLRMLLVELERRAKTKAH
jgi:hypothetical protein